MKATNLFFGLVLTLGLASFACGGTEQDWIEPDAKSVSAIKKNGCNYDGICDKGESYRNCNTDCAPKDPRNR